MSDKEPVFIDSNVLIYGNYGDPSKLEKFDTIIRTRIIPPVISTQVLKEFCNVSIRKQYAKTSAELLHRVDKITGTFIVRETTSALIKEAVVIHARYGYSFYDSLIIATALENNCKTLYSEDFHHGQVIRRKMKIVNPFR